MDNSKKSCIECQYCEEYFFGIRNHKYDKCGKASKYGRFCDLQREDNWFWSLIMGTCGKRGRWFQQKENK